MSSAVSSEWTAHLHPFWDNKPFQYKCRQVDAYTAPIETTPPPSGPSRTKCQCRLFPVSSSPASIRFPVSGKGRLTRDDTVKALLEPLDSLLGLDLVLGSDTALGVLPAGNTETGAAHDDEKVHAEDTDSGVVLDTEVDVLFDTETKVASLGEVAILSVFLVTRCEVGSGAHLAGGGGASSGLRSHFH